MTRMIHKGIYIVTDNEKYMRKRPMTMATYARNASIFLKSLFLRGTWKKPSLHRIQYQQIQTLKYS